MTSENRLNPESIRNRAQSIPGCHEIAHSETKKVISFLTGVRAGSPLFDPSEIARVNVYYHTGTVGTMHVLNREVREHFHKKASLETVEKILRNPENHKETTFSQLARIEEDELTDEIADSEEEWKKKLELADVAIAVLVAERDILMEHSKALEKKKKRGDHGSDHPQQQVPPDYEYDDEEDDKDEDEDSATDDTADDDYVAQKGKNFAYSLPDDTVAKVDEYLDCWEDVKCVTTNGQGTVVLYESGEWKFTQGTPRFLRNKLQGRQRQLPSPTYVSIGSEGQYYISFEDGDFEWMGCDKMSEILMKSKREVRSIAFGATSDTFFVVFHDGSWEYDGDIPSGLETKLAERGDRGDLTCVSLGPDGEWFLASRNGRRWWGGVSEELVNAVAPIKDRISFMDFGVDGSFMVRYT